MRIYTNPRDLVREVERDLFEMGIDVHPQTMQDKQVANDPDYMTKELQAYGFQLNGWSYNRTDEEECVNYILTGKFDTVTHPDFRSVMQYIDLEFADRTAGRAANPGRSWAARPKVWEQFLHNGKFAYTYSERMTPQYDKFFHELQVHPETRQAIINLHSNICPMTMTVHPGTEPRGSQVNTVTASQDLINMGGSGRIPCSLYYQAIKREGRLDLIYGMRSCDFLIHFPVDLFLALRFQKWVADKIGVKVGNFTYFSGSFHAYFKDLKTRGIF